MKDLSRRDLLRASAGAAIVAVPMVALAGHLGERRRSRLDADLDSSIALASSRPGHVLRP